MHVGATLAVARETGERFFAALRMTGTGDDLQRVKGGCRRASSPYWGSLACKQDGGESHHRFAVPLPLTIASRLAGRGARAIRESHHRLRVLLPLTSEEGRGGDACRGDPCGRPGTGARFFAALRMTGTGDDLRGTGDGGRRAPPLRC
jgi:hypothetical protein